MMLELIASLWLAAANSPAGDMHLIPGSFEKDRQPDGNSIVFEAPDELIVIDSGRHAEHQQKILDLARRLGKPVTTLVNTHWHLDHSGGNAELRAAHRSLRIVASRAVEGALDGFLAKSLAGAEAALADPQRSESQKAEIRGDAAAIADRANLIPDVVVEGPTSLPLKGRRLELSLARHAATGGDVWLYDPATGTAIVGDLVTLPAPFLDTACPEGWRRALDAVAARSPRQIIPGHGPPLTPAQFGIYRAAFASLIDCAEGAAPASTCIDSWMADLGPLLPPDQAALARGLLGYYFQASLRPEKRLREYCPPRD